MAFCWCNRTVFFLSQHFVSYIFTFCQHITIRYNFFSVLSNFTDFEGVSRWAARWYFNAFTSWNFTITDIWICVTGKKPCKMSFGLSFFVDVADVIEFNFYACALLVYNVWFAFSRTRKNPSIYCDVRESIEGVFLLLERAAASHDSSGVCESQNISNEYLRFFAVQCMYIAA